MDVYLVVFDKRSFKLSGQLYAEVKSYIDETLVDTYTAVSYHRRLSDEKKLYRTIIQKPATQELHTDLCVQERSLEEVVSQLEDSFSQMVFRFITQKDYRKLRPTARRISTASCSPRFAATATTILANPPPSPWPSHWAQC